MHLLQIPSVYQHPEVKCIMSMENVGETLCHTLRSLSSQSASKLDVLGLNGDTLGMDGAQVGWGGC